MTMFTIPQDGTQKKLFVEHRENVVFIGQEGSGKIYEDIVNLSHSQAEQLRDYLNNLFEVEK